MPRFVLATLVLVGILAGCGGTSEPAEGVGGKLTLVAYSTPREVYAQLTEDFAKTPAGEGFSFDESYGSSGEQSRAVASGLPADIVAFSLEPDVTRLVRDGFIGPDWVEDQYKGMVTESVVVFVVRKGNPEGIRTWDDLVKPDVEVITPNPFTSGGARWNVMAAFGAQKELGRTDQQAAEYLRRLFHNVSVQDKSARESLQTFVGGKGDVLLAYENEAILAQQKGEEIEYVIPDQTILIENPIAVVASSKHPEAARAFVDYVRSPQAQRVFGKAGYRPVNDRVAGEFDFPKPKTLFTIADLGGWKIVSQRFFDRAVGVMATIQQELGEPLE